MNPISSRAGKVPQHIGASREVLKMIQSFLLRQKRTRKSVGRLAQRWLSCARAPRAFSAWLWRWSSCLLPQLVLSCLVFLFLPSRHILELLCSRACTSVSEPVDHYPHAHRGASDNCFILSPCHVLGPGQGTLCACLGDAKVWFSPVHRRANGGCRGEGILPQSHCWWAQSRLLAQFVHLASKPKVCVPHCMAFLPILTSYMFTTFQALLSELLEGLISRVSLFLRGNNTYVPYCPKQSLFIQDIL